MRSVGSRTFRPRSKRVIFGEAGRVDITYTGDLPFEHRGAFTGRLYVWRRARPKWVDKRDLPKLIKLVGLDDLVGLEIDLYKERKLAAAKERAAKKRAKEREKAEVDHEP